MKGDLDNNKQIGVIGSGKLAYSVTVCLLRAGHPVILYTDSKEKAKKRIDIHFNDLKGFGYSLPEPIHLQVTENLKSGIDTRLIIAITEETLEKKRNCIEEIEQYSTSETIIAMNTESIPLNLLQKGSIHPERIAGANWTVPAHTTKFLELIKNEITSQKYVDELLYLSREFWSKDTYIVSGNYGIRSKMIAAMAREAFYLVENGYASVEDIDRACRNDAGYYLPFAGNCRYMDLMGTYIYGLVMKDLNPDLSTGRGLPDFFTEILKKGGKGMENGDGLYQYNDEDIKNWDEKFRRFSYQIKQVMDKYPFKG